MYLSRTIPGSILIVDDELAFRETLEVFLRKRGYRVASCANSSEALERVTQEPFDLVIADASAPGATGLQFLDQIKARCADEDVVMMSAYATIDQSVEAMRRGASDYLTKPFQLHEVANIVERVIVRRREAAGKTASGKGTNGRLHNGQRNGARNTNQEQNTQAMSVSNEAVPALIGSSTVMKQLFAIIDRIAPFDSSVLITGATGTGKELVARAIHDRSRRNKAPFIDINCSAIPDTLVEAELFGHQRGTFTGAHETRRGLFEEASGGTIFLDEIDALDLSAQAKLLRVLQERMLRRVGGRENIPIDVRVVSATNRDLSAAVAEGKFRADLLFRLRVVPLHMPHLRERGNDIILLLENFLRRHASRWGLAERRFSAEALRSLLEYHWPGNVRELENAVEYALAIGVNDELGIDDLPPEILKRNESSNDDVFKQYPFLPLVEIERRYIISVLERFGGHQIKTAAALGIDRRTLYRKLQQYKVKTDRDENVVSIF
ncbi:MAG TPA: sigma-54 dependent transcriptional regulator [Pyrinomonadaceae bacterium]|nr:sigma-54 dependent transcriptional regulator [Pyrinomonadaceae bacterium]